MRFPASRPSPALVISVIALFVAMGGTSYAAIKITGKNVKNGSLSGADVKNSSLSGSDVKNNSLGGSDVKESKLGKIPKATTADSAASAKTAAKATDSGKLEGLALRGISQWTHVNSAGAVISSSGNVSVTKLAAGRYRVKFPTDVSKCGLNANGGSGANASDGTNFANRMVMLGRSTTGATDVQVGTVNDAGTAADNPFFLTVQC